MNRSKFDAELDPERDLKGATPETLARALGLSRQRKHATKRRRNPVSRVREESADYEGDADETRDEDGSDQSSVSDRIRDDTGRAPDGSPLSAIKSR